MRSPFRLLSKAGLCIRNDARERSSQLIFVLRQHQAAAQPGIDLEDPHGADIRADLYSLGCTFYFLLTAQVPFPGGSLLSKLDKQRWHSPTALEHLRGDIPPAVARLVEKLMAKRPADRVQTPGELAAVLTALAANGYEDPPVPRVEFKEVRRMIGHADAIL